jgi:hypothetical protein
MKRLESTSTGFEHYTCSLNLCSRAKPALTRWGGALSSFKKSVLLAIGLSFLLGACSGGSNSVNYSSLNYSSLNYSSVNYRDYAGPHFQAIDFSRNLVTEDDPSALMSVVFEGQVPQLMPDSRSDIDNIVNAFVFTANYESEAITIFVNPEFGDQAAAQEEAEFYAEVIGRIPVSLRNGISNGVSFLYIHQGFEPLASNQDYIAIYTGRATELNNRGILEETLIHESVHVSLDLELQDPTNSSTWLAAQTADGNAISQLAYDLGSDEDAAETMLAYIAVQYRANRLDAFVKDTIRATIPNRIDFFNSLGLDMSPIVLDVPPLASTLPSFSQSPALFAYYEQWEQTITF